MDKIKALIIMHNPISESTGTGKTVKAIFESFDSDELAEIFITSGETDFRSCKEFFQISDGDVAKKRLKLKRTCGSVISNNLYFTKDTSQKGGFIINILRDLSRSSIAIYIRNFIWDKNNWLTDYLESWVRQVNPNFIFVVPGYIWGIMDIALYFSNKLEIPLVTYVTDDYFVPRNKIVNGLLGEIVNRKLVEKYNQLSKQAKLHYVIGEKMAFEYQRRFGCEHMSIMNCVTLTERNVDTNNKKQSDIFKIVYAGNCGLGRAQTLMVLAEAIDLIEVPNLEIRLDIYTPSAISSKLTAKFHRFSCCQYKGSLREKELTKVLLDADILVHVESFKKRYKHLLSTAISTKLPEYMAYRKPILVIAPYYAGSLDYVDSNCAGFCIKNNDAIVIRNEIIKVVNKEVSFDNYIENGWRLVCSKHNVEIVSKEFKDKIWSVLLQNNVEQR